jgi:hypothetical protein
MGKLVRGDDFWWWQGAATLICGAFSFILLRPAILVWIRWSPPVARGVVDSLAFLGFLVLAFLVMTHVSSGAAIPSVLAAMVLAIVVCRWGAAWVCRHAFPPAGDAAPPGQHGATHSSQP